MSRFHVFLKNVIWQYSATLFTIIAEFASIALISNSLGARAVGLLSFGYAFAFLINQFFDIRSTEIVIKYFTETLRECNDQVNVSFVWGSFIVEIVLRSAAFLVSLTIAFLGYWFSFLESTTFQVILLSALSMFFNTLVTGPSRGALRVLRCFEAQALISFLSACLKVGLVFVVLHFGLERIEQVAWAIAVASIVTPVTCFLLTYRSLMSRLGEVEILRFNLAEARGATNLESICTFAKFQYITSLTMLPTKELDINILTSVAGFESVGLYKVAKNIVSAIGSLPDAVFLVIYPELAESISKKTFVEMWRFIRYLTIVMSIITVLGFVLAVLVFPEVAAVSFGSKFRNSAKYFNVLLIGLAVWAPLVWLNPLILAAGRPDIITKGSLIAMVFVSVLFFLLGNLSGAAGVAVASALSTPIVLGVIAFVAYRAGVFESLRQKC